MSSRAELEAMGREALIALAASKGVANARALPRVDLIDEVLMRDGGESRSARGLFGLARDLLARVVERGLHLPDAAAKAAEMVMPPAPELKSEARGEIATVTLATIYASQGLRERALETVDKVLAQKPGDAAASALRDHLNGAVLHVAASCTLARTRDGVRIEWNAGSVGEELPVLRVLRVTPEGTHPVRQTEDRVVAARGSIEIDVSARTVVRAAIGVGHEQAFRSLAHA